MKRVYYNERLLTAAGYQITRYREQNGLTQEELSEILGYHQSYICHLELGTLDLTRFFVDRMRWHCDVDLTQHLPKEARKQLPQLVEVTYDIMALEKLTLSQLATLMCVNHTFLTNTLRRTKKSTTRSFKRFIQLLKESFPEYSTQIDISLSI